MDGCLCGMEVHTYLHTASYLSCVLCSLGADGCQSLLLLLLLWDSIVTWGMWLCTTLGGRCFAGRV